MSPFRFVLELYRGSTRVGHAPLPPEAFEASLECVEFAAVRKGRLPPELGHDRRWVATPIWDPDLGEPFAAGVEVSLLGPHSVADRSTVGRCRVAAGAFQLHGQDAANALVRAGRLGEKERVVYRLVAYAAGVDEGPAEGRAGANGANPRFEAVPQPLPLREARLDALLAGAELRGKPGEDEMPLLLPERVLEEADALKTAAGGVETGGILVGRLHRDRRRPEILAEVTAQIPVRHARAQAHRLEFTPETWTDVRHAIELRGAGELMLGWWHSHPARTWCGKCEPARRRTCPLARGFFSAADRRLHRTVFPRAYSVALVVGDRVREDLEWESYHEVYGWSQGDLFPRGYHVMENVHVTEDARGEGGNHGP